MHEVELIVIFDSGDGDDAADENADLCAAGYDTDVEADEDVDEPAPIEACDDGNDVEGDGCDTNCTESACGNFIVAGDEECDDGNLDNGDGCESDCTLST